MRLANLTSAQLTTRPIPPSNLITVWSATLTPHGMSGYDAMTYSQCKWMAPRDQQLLACVTFGLNTMAIHRVQSGTQISSSRSTLWTAGKNPRLESYENAFKIQWNSCDMSDEPFPWNLLEGAKGVQLAELGLQSSDERKWIDLPELKA